MRVTSRAFLLVAALTSLPAQAASLHVDTFSTGPDDWTTGGSAVAWQSTGGATGAGDGFILVATQPGNLAAHNSSPAWTGSFADVNAVAVTADLMAPVDSASLAIRVVLFGPGTDPSFSPRWTSTVAATVPNDGVWRNYTFGLDSAALTRVLGTGTHAALMDNVLRVMLRHDPATPSAGGTAVVGSLAVDNVALVAPAPPAFAGDYNADGIIDAADYTVWADNQGAAAGTLPNDVDGGVIGAAQYQTWRAHFGAVQAGAASLHTAQVPEPNAWLTVALSASVLSLSRLAANRRPKKLPRRCNAIRCSRHVTRGD